MHATPYTISTITYKIVQCTLQLRGLIHSPYFIPTPMYSVVYTVQQLASVCKYRLSLRRQDCSPRGMPDITFPVGVSSLSVCLSACVSANLSSQRMCKIMCVMLCFAFYKLEKYQAGIRLVFITCTGGAKYQRYCVVLSWKKEGYMERTWIQTVTLCQVDCDCLYFALFMMRLCLSTLQRCQPQRQFHERWVVKTGCCQRDFSQTNEQHRHLKEKLISELHEEIELIQTS